MYKFNIENSSPWILDLYNKIIPYKNNGFLVEIGVGHTIEGSDWEIGKDWTKRTESNTADLLDLGWNGIYIDPVKEYCDEAKLCHTNNLDRLSIINLGCSNTEEEKILYLGDSFVGNSINTQYTWLGRKIQCRPTSTILLENKCPRDIDIMSIDVEGYELKVLQGLNFYLHRPKIIIIEINSVGIDPINNLLLSNYELFSQDSLNAGYFIKD
jgi:FkbM family methyltransferase